MVSSLKRAHWRKGSMRDMRSQKGVEDGGEPGAKCVFWRRPWGKGVFWENIISWALWGWTGEKTQVVCAITTVQIHSLGQSRRIKIGQRGVAKHSSAM
jgi:hypothetical protein